MQDPDASRPKRPFDTRVSVTENPGGLEIVIPPPRLSVGHVAAFLFIGMFFVIPLVVTSGGNAPRWVALPFWAVCAGFTGTLLTSLVRTTRITAGPQTTSLEQRPFGSRRSLRTAEIVVRAGRRPSSGEDDRGRSALLLEYGTKTFYLMFGYSEQEQRWVADQLREWLRRVSS